MERLPILLLTATLECVLKIYWSLSGTERVVWEIQPLLEPGWPSSPLQIVLLVSAQQDGGHSPLFPAPHLNLFCFMSLPDSPHPLHFSVSVAQSRNYTSLELHTPASICGLFCVSLNSHSLKLLQVLSELNWWHSTILAHVDSQGTQFPRCCAVWLVSLLQVILSIGGSVMCRLWRQTCHLWDSWDIRDLPGLHPVQVSEIFTLYPPQKWDLFLFSQVSVLPMFFLYECWRQKTLTIISGHCIMCEISSGTGDTWKGTF